MRDYRTHGAGQIITGGSPFNIKVESLRLGDFSAREIEILYSQHTAETGQAFESGVYELLWSLTRGQPWLVNALAREACFRDPAGRDRSKAITASRMQRAKEQLILRRDTHIDQLGDKLGEERVRRVIQPILTGTDFDWSMHLDDIEYAIDLGLLRREGSKLEIANGIYREVIPRELSYTAQIDFAHQQETVWYQRPDGSLDISCGDSSSSSAKTARSGSSDSTTRRRARTFSCKHSCSES